jgi:hypothetical protein
VIFLAKRILLFSLFAYNFFTHPVNL